MTTFRPRPLDEEEVAIVPPPAALPKNVELMNHSLDKLNKLSNMLDLELGPPNSEERKSYENRMENLEPLRNYVVEKMRRVSDKFG